MSGKLVWLDPGEIKNPFEGYFDVTENIKMAKSQGFERCKQAVLAHAHEVDIDKLVEQWFDSIDWERDMVKHKTTFTKPFSKYLAEMFNE